jgi:hypothetical protein
VLYFDPALIGTRSEAQLSVNCHSATAALVFFPGAARTQVIPSNFSWTAHRDAHRRCGA